MELTSEQGHTVWMANYTGFGQAKVANGRQYEARNPIRFQGQYEDDEIGLHYNRFRYYDPLSGQYTQQDPIGLAGGELLYQYTSSPYLFADPLGLTPWRWNPDTGMGHHLVPRKKAESVGLDLLATKRHTPTFFPEPYQPGDHERIHQAQKPYIGKLQGAWTGTADELLENSKKGLTKLNGMRGTLKIPATGKIIAKNVTPSKAFDKLMLWHKKMGKSC